MFKRTLLVVTILTAACIGAPSITSVTVSEDMLHAHGGTILGKVSYTLDADGCDSVFVQMAILPVGGGDALRLDVVEGDIGSIHVLYASKERAIWFKYNGQTAGQYVARVTADVVASGVLTKVNQMIAAASTNNKVTMFSGDGDFFHTPGLSTGAGTLPQIRSDDGPHGIHKRTGGDNVATCFTTCGGVACSWDPDLAYEQGEAMGKEFRANGRIVQLGPAMNIVWHHRLGRAFEYYSEDSYLSGKMAAATVRGIQSKGVAACIKHFVANNMENNRNNISANVDERSLRELFLPQFRECVTEGGALSLMTAYNAVNGNFSTGNEHLLQDILRDTWGFRGYSMSDWDARITNETECIKYGVDVLLRYRGPYTVSNFSAIDASFVDNHARRIVWAMGKTGMLENGYNYTAYQSYFRSQEVKMLVRRVGSRGIVLLKNEGNVLPIPKTGATIFIETEGGDMTTFRYGGGFNGWESSKIVTNSSEVVTPKEGIERYLQSVGAGATTIVTNKWQADYIICAVGPEFEGSGEGKDRTSDYVARDSHVAGAMGVSTAKTVVLYTGGSASLPGQWSNAPAILCCFHPGQEQGLSIADVLFGDVNPGGKLNVTFPKQASHAVNFNASGTNLNYPQAHIAHGYFKVDAEQNEPLFAFGHGLSYTTFSYTNLTVFPESIKKGDRVYVGVDVTNTGSVDGDEVAQLYLSLPTGGVPVRKQDLRGFDRVTIAAGETERVEFTLDFQNMAYFQVGSGGIDGSGQWEMKTGSYGVRVGTSSKITPVSDQPSLAGAFTVTD